MTAWAINRIDCGITIGLYKKVEEFRGLRSHSLSGVTCSGPTVRRETSEVLAVLVVQSNSLGEVVCLRTLLLKMAIWLL